VVAVWASCLVGLAFVALLNLISLTLHVNEIISFKDYNVKTIYSC
jgi:hypothetical protein